MHPLSEDVRRALDVLGLPPEAHRDDIVRAFRRLARSRHPDVSDAPDAEARFEALVEAYGVALRDVDALASPPPPARPAPSARRRPGAGWPAGWPAEWPAERGNAAGASRPPIVAGPPVVRPSPRTHGSSTTARRRS